MTSLISVRPEFRAYQDAGVFTLADVHTACASGGSAARPMSGCCWRRP